MFKKFFKVLVLVLVFLVMFVSPVTAQDPEPPADVPALPDFLEQLAGPVGWGAVGILFSQVLAGWGWYEKQTGWVKRVFIIGGAAVVAVAAQLLITYVPADAWAAIAPYWHILAGVVMTWIGSQVWFRAAVKPDRMTREFEAPEW